ncbi:glucokinase [Frankia torreyi]|uniref:Glucokinase n=1 Tax=Frankia torreyi TaxID=1856 RepID=A0A0D8BA21_9ACTN|nr:MULTISPECIES: ROK family glucokinase [Frankia]KJE20960.1 glucokinase [Frankia torreyi]KQM03830.1 glucokinase [Frankia sp. CpI1-P]
MSTIVSGSSDRPGNSDRPGTPDTSSARPTGSDAPLSPLPPAVADTSVDDDRRTAGLTIGVDVGGTKVAAGVVDGAGTVLASVRRPTPGHSASEVADTIAAVVAELSADYEVKAVGIGAAGWIDANRSRVLFAPNLAWRDEPLRDEVSGRVGLPVVVENDANAMAWAEYRFGAGRGRRDLVCLTVGTGIGSGIVLGGELYRGAFGIGAETGHMRMVPDGHLCGCGNHGCWEQYASGRALVRAARQIAALDPSAAAAMLEACGGDAERLTGPDVTEAARKGDPAAIRCLTEIGQWLGEGMASLTAVLDPDRFVIGGGVSDSGELLLGPARERFAQTVPGRAHRPRAEVVIAELGSQAGLVGAADLARI